MEEQDLDFDIVYSNPKAKTKKSTPPVSEDLDFELVESSVPVKKKNPLKPVTAGPSTQAKPKSSLGLGGQVITGPSASIPYQPKTAEGQQKIGALDDLWNTLKGAGLKTLADMAKVPEMAQTYALDLVTTAMGKNDEFNRLPAAAKKEIRNVVNSTSKVTPLPNVQLSNQAADYLNKRSEEVYQKTRKEEGDIVDEITNFAKNPSVEGVGNILYRGLKSTVESVPFMAGYALSPALVGVSAAAGKRAEDLEKTGGNLGVNYLLNSGITGGSEVLAQGVTNKIMGRAAKAAFGNPKAAEILGSGYKNLIVKEIAKDMGEEFVAEAATEATQGIADDILNGRDVDWWGIGRRTLNAGITGAVSAGTIRSGGEIVGSARNYLATQIMPKADKDKINNNIKTISELNTQKGDDINPEVNTIIDNKIKELETQNTSMMSVAQSAADNLTDDQIKQVVDIDDQLYDNFNKAKAIFDDQSMDQEAKDLLLKDLLDKKKLLDEQKDAIQKQTTGQIPVQPEAGARQQMAEGESQAEPQVPTQEGQEVVDITANIPKQDLPKVMDLVDKIEKGQQVSSPEDLQTQQNYAKEVESLLNKRATDTTMPTVATIDVTTPVKFEEGDMPEIPVGQIDWEASGMGTENDAIDSFGGINDITVVDVQGKNEQGQYIGKVRVTGQDTSREGVVVFNDPNAPRKPKAARKKNVSPEFLAVEKVLSDNGVYPSFENVEEIVKITKGKAGNITQQDVQDVVKVYNKKAKAIADAFNKQKTDENIQAKQPRAKVAAEETTQGAQPEAGATDQPAQVSSKRQEIKSSLEKLKDVGLLRSAITGKKDISQGEIDSQMALTDAMANVWKETTGRDDFYENFFNDVSQGDIDGIMEKGGVLFQNLELPQRPLTRVSLGVFDLPEFKKMEGQEVSINSVKDLAKTRGKQIEKELMQTVLDYDKYKDAKKISYDEFKSDVEMQVMKLEKINTSSYASYGVDNLGDSDIYGNTNTIIYNSPVDHGHTGNHFKLRDFKLFKIDSEVVEWEIKQIPGTDQYAAVDKSMPGNVSPDQLGNYIGTAGSKEAVERWVSERSLSQMTKELSGEGNVNVGLFGHTRVWYDKGNPYYLAEIQSDYFQKNDPNDLYLDQVNHYDAALNASNLYFKNDAPEYLNKFETQLKQYIELKESDVDGDPESKSIDIYIKVPNKDKNTVDLKKAGVVFYDINTYAGKNRAKLLAFEKVINVLNAVEKIPSEYKDAYDLAPYSLTREGYIFLAAYKEDKKSKTDKYEQEYIKNEIEKIKNSEKGVSMLKQFVASQKVHELRLLRESFRNAAQEGAETLRFPTPYTLAVIEGYVSKKGETPYEIVEGNSDRLYEGDIIDYGGTEMVVVNQNAYSITVAPRDEVQIYDYYDFIDSEVEYFLDETLYSLRRDFNDVNNITESDVENFDFEGLNWQASDTKNILEKAISESEDGIISLSSVEDIIRDSIRDSFESLSYDELFMGEDVFSDGDQTYYVVERRNRTEVFGQPDEYDMGDADPDLYESNLGSAQKTVINKYKELNKMFKKMRPDAEVITDDNGMQWLETNITPEDASNPVIAFQEEGGNIKGAVDFSNDNKASVYMFDGADISTLAHEMSGHLGRRFLEQLSSVDEDFAKDYEAAKEWAGVRDNQWTIAAEEKWARGFEKYLRDGKAPTKALKSVFENLRDWLKNIYKYIKGSSIDIELTPQITKVFDNLLGARSEDVGIKELPGYDRMMGEVEGIVDKSFKRGVSYNQTLENALSYLSTSKVYEDATDIQRESMVREIRKMFKKKEKKAPTAQKILGQEPTKTTVVIDEAKEINKRLKALEAAEQTGRKKGYKEGTKESEDAKKDIIDIVRAMKVNNKISGSQFKAIVNALKGNLLNPVIRKRVEERIAKIINRSNYADQIERANKLSKAIRKASKSKTLPANISKMARNFGKIKPNSVPNIEEYMDMATLVYDSIGKPMRSIASEDMINEYTELRLQEARDAKNDVLAEQYKALVDGGILPSGMSLKEIQDYILSVEQKKAQEISKEKEKEMRANLKAVFEALSDISNVIATEGINPLTGEEIEVSAEDKKMIQEFTKMDLDKLPIPSAYRAQEALMNYVINGKKFGMRSILAKYQGEENVKIANDKGLKAADFRWAVGGSWWGSRKWAKEVESIPGLFTWLFRGRNRGGEMMKLMGLDEFMAGAAEAKLKRIEAENEYIAKFLGKKPNGKRFNNINNTYERLVYAYLSRTVDGTPEQKQAEFDRRKRILLQNVQAMYQSRNKELIEEGSVLEKELNKVKNAKNPSEMKDKFDKINIDAAEFASNMFEQDYDFIEGVAEGVYNLILSKDELYTPDMFRDIRDKNVNVAEAQETVDLPFDLLNKKPAGTMMENKRIQNLPGYDVENRDASNVEKILRLDFDASVFNAYEKALVDAYTAEAVQKYSAFVNSKDFSKLFDNAKDEQLFKEIVNFYINNERGKIGYKSDWKAVQNFTNRIKSLSTYRALGSITAIVKQSASAAINTAINLSNDPYALKQVANAMFFNSDIQDFINKNRSEINLRGAESTADIKSAEKLIRDSKYQTLNDVLDTVDKAGRLQMKSLAAGDVPLARASWFGYYIHALKKEGKPYKNIDWATEKIDKDALAYANREVSLNQNASMPSTMGRAFSSKNPATKLIMAYVFPYTSFLFNAKSRLKTDITVLTSKLATAEDKQAAGRSMVATLAELPAYIAMQTAINYGLVSLANIFLGYDEDEEDENLRLKRYSELAVTRIITDLLSPTPNVGDVATVAAFNALLTKMQEDPEMEEEEKMDVFKLFENKPDSMLAAMAELLLQPLASTGRRTADIYTTIDMATGDYYVTETGKEIEFTEEDKKFLNIAATMQLMGSLNLLPSEAESLAKKMVKTIEKRAKEESM